MNVAERFGANLARARKAAGLSQADLEARSSVHHNQISLFERGKRLPRLDTFIRLAEALEASTDDLVADIHREDI